MVFAIGCVHPAGEADDYDGLYFRQNEMETLATDLAGLPVCVEHLDDKPIGRVVHAWVNPEDSRLFAMLETNSDNFQGILAGRMLLHNLTGELSLGHKCEIDNVANRVVSKKPTEVSIVERGAREHTQIYSVDGQNPQQRYINNSFVSVAASEDSISPRYTKMSTDATPAESKTGAPDSKTIIKPSAAPQDTQTMMTQLLEQVKMLTAANEKMKARNESDQKKYASYEEQMAKEKELGKRKREQAVDGSIKDYFKALISKYQNELKPHENDLLTMMEGMKDNALSTPMVEALACCAAQASTSTTELEAAYQENKRLKALIEENKTALANAVNPYFSSKKQRVTVEAAASANSAAEAPIQSIFRSSTVDRVPAGRGMKELNPGMWGDLLKSAKRGTGMPTVEEFLKIGNNP